MSHQPLSNVIVLLPSNETNTCFSICWSWSCEAIYSSN